jgi:hypothetical protein
VIQGSRRKVHALYELLRALIEAILAVALALGVLPTVQADGTAYYVARDGDDANPGTLQAPWRTIGKVNRELRPGDTVYIRAGTYDEIIEPDRSGTPGNPITYTRYQDEEVVIAGESGTAKLVALHDKSYIVVDGLTLSYGHAPPGGEKRWAWVFMGEHAEHNEIRACRIIRVGDPLELYESDYREFGILISGGMYNIIADNTITGVNMGVKLGDAARYNRVLYNNISGVGQSCIVVGSSQGVMQGTLIEGNTLEGSAVEDGIQFMENTDLSEDEREFDISNFGTIIRYNVIRHHAENAIDLKGAAHVVIEGNTIYGSVGSSEGPLHKDGWNREAMHSIGCSPLRSSRDVIIRRNVIFDGPSGIGARQDWQIYNNTIVGNNRDYTGPDSDYQTSAKPAFFGIRQWVSNEGGLAIQNNIIIGHNTVEVVLRPRQALSEINYIDYNLYYNTEGVFFAAFRTTEDWSKYTLSQWRRHLRQYDTINGNESQSLVADPRFEDAPERPVGEYEQFDFRLKDRSPAVDAGGPLTRTDGSGSGKQIHVTDAGYFFDGYGVTDGDLVQIGENSPVRITATDYDQNLITVDGTISWEDGDWVNLPYNGTAPDLGAYECEGECRPAPPRPIPDERVVEGLQLLYTFEEGGGTTVRDLSGAGAPLDLTIQDPSAISWPRTALSINAPTVISSVGIPLKIVDACRSGNALTLEAWVRPASADQDGPARILTLSPDLHNRNATLGQEVWDDGDQGVYDVRLRTTEQSENGEPSLSTLPGSVWAEPTHVVYVRDAAGIAQFYVNNELHVIGMTGGSLASWDEGYPLLLGNEGSGDRPWLGKLYLVAIYCRALDNDEIWQNYAHGLSSIMVPWSFLPMVLRRR